MNEYPPQSKEPPRCIAVLLCNEVIEDKRTNNKTLVSLFNSIGVGALPATHDRMFIMASFTNGIGSWPLTFRIIGPSGDELVRMQGEAEFNDPLAVMDIVIEIRQLELREAGQHIIDVLAGNTPLSERRFVVQTQGTSNPQEG